MPEAEIIYEALSTVARRLRESYDAGHHRSLDMEDVADVLIQVAEEIEVSVSQRAGF